MYAIRSYYEAGGTAIANKASVSSKEGAKSIIDDAVKAFGTVHILVNNAGILRDKTFKNRITSYNVCYTKLLRNRQIAPSPRSRR